MKKLVLYTLAILLVSLQSCTDRFQELNTNPAGFGTIDPRIQLAKIQADLSGHRQEAWDSDLDICTPMIQHLTGSYYSSEGAHYTIMLKSHWYTLWENTYPRDLKNIQDIIDRTAKDPALININAAARILRVYIYSRLTDLYGDIPYSQAIKGYTDKVFLPRYDKQEDIYKDFFKELGEATASIDNSKEAVTGDLFFNGDIDKWKKFGNSLRLRLGFRLTKVDVNEARKQVEAAIVGGVMPDNSYTCMIKHGPYNFGGDENRGNGRSQVFQSALASDGLRLTTTLVDYMKSTDDPRLFIYGRTYTAPLSGNMQINNAFNLDITDHLNDGLAPGTFWWDDWNSGVDITLSSGQVITVPVEYQRMQPSHFVAALDAPFFHLTYAEVEFLLAEAAARGWGGLSNVKEHFDKGIQASCQTVGLYPGAPAIEQADIDALKASFDPFPADFQNRMRVIHEQMWVNFFLNGYEAYANYRRTGYPALTLYSGDDSQTNGVMPRRFFYPESESLQNPRNYQEAVSRLGGTDDWLKSVWWDKE
jgi:hypothetical protein